MKKPSNPKERNLVKGALRRVFSRSELRREALDAAKIEHSDPERPRVTKWVFCAECGHIFPAYLAQVDHKVPIIPVDSTLEDMSWDQLIDNLWCELDNLSVLDKICHKTKTKEESRERKHYKNRRENK